MADSVYINLPVKDLEKTNHFFRELGFEFHGIFSNEQATCMFLKENVFVMLLRNDFFKTYTKREISDAYQANEMVIAFDRGSKEDVNELVDKAVSLGAREVMEPRDHGHIYGRSFHDLDGHIWEVFWMKTDVF